MGPLCVSVLSSNGDDELIVSRQSELWLSHFTDRLVTPWAAAPEDTGSGKAVRSYMTGKAYYKNTVVIGKSLIF